ncbi:MAG TPA: shufflon system plasmid conjugative transfer pilus tip adhesin PilV [Noviherbaspirillum sp.]|nr:shufflon system plasmid conjugative transfer pilus tip adhesin PilV [Noviherbaspirillum sp.]
MKALQRGFTLNEVIGALFIGSLMMVGLTAMMDTTLEDTRGQQAALYQAQVTNAAAKLIAERYTDLLATATSTTPVVFTVADLRNARYLPQSFSDRNAYGQAPCVRILRPAAAPPAPTDRLDALITTAEGREIPAAHIAYVAANAGQGGGFIPSTVTPAPPTPAPLEARGGSWDMTPAELAPYLSVNCAGIAAPTAGHLASALFYDGPGQLSTDFVYRNRVGNRDDLNTMMTPLRMRHVANVGSTDDLCNAGNMADSWGRIAVDSSGAVVSCQGGRWQRSGSWKDPMPTHTALTLLPAVDNRPGDVRMVTALNRAFTWNGTNWVALAVDENGNMTVEKKLTTNDIQINSTVVKGNACTSTGLVARDANGLLLSCQFGVWTTQTALELGASAPGDEVILKSNYISYPSGTVFHTGTIAYDAADDWYTATIKRTIVPAKNGVLAVNMTSRMNRELWNSSSQEGQLEITIAILNKDTNTIIGTSQNMSLRFANDSTASSVNLTKAVTRNTNGYEVRIITRWSTYNGNGTTGNGLYTRANYKDAQGTVVEETPIRTNWTLDLFY